jgi:hypothetical protein
MSFWFAYLIWLFVGLNLALAVPVEQPVGTLNAVSELAIIDQASH